MVGHYSSIPNSGLHHDPFSIANRGMNDDADRLYKRALAMREEALDSRHPDVAAASLNNLSALRKSQVMWH